MSQRTFGTLAVIALAALAFLGGYWCEHSKYLRAAADLRTTYKILDDARARQRLYHLEVAMLQVLERAAAKDYKEAESRAEDLFIEVRAEIARPDMNMFKGELEEILAKADDVRTALDKGDPVVRDLLRGMMIQLARAVEPPTPSEPPPILSSTPVPQS